MPLEGAWPFGSRFPALVDARDLGIENVLPDSTEFRRARLQEDRPGILKQYRENRLRDSLHLHVLDDGRWRIDHADAFNPDAGPWSAFRHFFADHPLGRLLSR